MAVTQSTLETPAIRSTNPLVRLLRWICLGHGAIQQLLNHERMSQDELECYLRLFGVGPGEPSDG